MSFAPAMFVSSAVLLLLSGFWFLATYNNDPAAISALDAAVLFPFVGAVLAAQAAFLIFAARFKPPGRYLLFAAAAAECFAAVRYAAGVSPVFAATAFAMRAGFWSLFLFSAVRRFAFCLEGLCALFAVVNFYTLHLSFVVGFDTLPGPAQLILLAAGWAVMRNFFASLSGAGRWRKMAVAFSGVLFLAQAAQTVAGGGAASASSARAENVRTVRFVKKPNVYFFAFESLLPASLAKMHLHLDSLPHQEELESLGFRRFRNAFSDSADTASSLNRLLALDPAHFQKLAEEGGWRGMFSGLAPSPLLQIFRANGYSVHLYNHDGYLGEEESPHLDGYQITTPYALCAQPLAGGARDFGLFGYCRWIQNARLTGAFGLPVFALADAGRYLDSVLENIAAAAAKEKPALFFARVHSPDHVPAGYSGGVEEFAAFRELYFRLSAQTAELMAEIVRFARANDPDAILVFFGDHGVRLSQPLGEMSELGAAEKRFAVRDRYGVLAAAHPADVCREYFDEAEARGFVTNAIIARAVLRCLAGGEDPAIGEWEYVVWEGPVPSLGSPGKALGWYENYLYE